MKSFWIGSIAAVVIAIVAGTVLTGTEMTSGQKFSTSAPGFSLHKQQGRPLLKGTALVASWKNRTGRYSAGCSPPPECEPDTPTSSAQRL